VVLDLELESAAGLAEVAGAQDGGLHGLPPALCITDAMRSSHRAPRDRTDPSNPTDLPPLLDRPAPIGLLNRPPLLRLLDPYVGEDLLDILDPLAAEVVGLGDLGIEAHAVA